MNIFRKAECFGYLTGGIVISGNHVNRNAGFPKSAGLGYQIKPGVVIFPIPVIEVSGNENEMNLLGNGGLNQIVESPPGGLTNVIYRSPVIIVELVQRAVQMNIGCMDKFKHISIQIL
jgi:hypothetical protein